MKDIITAGMIDITSIKDLTVVDLLSNIDAEVKLRQKKYISAPTDEANRLYYLNLLKKVDSLQDLLTEITKKG